MQMQQRTPGGEQPYWPAGPFKIRLPFVHYRWEMAETIQGLVMFVVGLAMIPLLEKYLGMPYEAALAFTFIAGLGYILPMTFLPAVAHDWNLQLNPSAWLLVAIASIPSTIIWNSLGTRLGDRNALIINYAVQAVAVAAILVMPEAALGLWICAIFMGGSFLGAVFLTQRLARTLHPHQGPRLSAALIALYGVAQLVGPILAEVGINMGATLAATFIWGLGACIWGMVLMFWVPTQRTH